MKIGSVVIVNLTTPTQRFLGRLMALDPAGVTLRGVDLESFEDWMNSIAASEEGAMRPTTTFFPLHRMEKMILDEGAGAIPSLADTFLTRVGKTLEDHLEYL